MRHGSYYSSGQCTLFYIHVNVRCHLGTDLFVHKGIMSAVKKVESVSDSLLYAILGSNIMFYMSSAHTEDTTN
jgi:hypothetical protein